MFVLFVCLFVVAVQKLQSSQSGTVNGLLEEVRRAEEGVAKERRRAGAEVP
jgi:hypothetical protein